MAEADPEAGGEENEPKVDLSEAKVGGESLLGKGPVLVPVAKCGPGDIRSVLVQNFSDLYEVDMNSEPPKPVEEKEERKGEGEEEEKEEDKKEEAAKKANEEEDGDEEKKEEEPPKDPELVAMEEEVLQIKKSLEGTITRSQRIEQMLESHHKQQLEKEHAHSRTMKETWGLIASVDIPMPVNIVESDDGKSYLPTLDEAAAGTMKRKGLSTLKEMDEISDSMVDLHAIMETTSKERKDFTRQRKSCPPPGSRPIGGTLTRKDSLPPLETTAEDKDLTFGIGINEELEGKHKMTMSKMSKPTKRARSAKGKTQQKLKVLVRKMPRGDQVAEDKRVLDRMSRKLNFLKNPRFAPAGTGSTLSYSTAMVGTVTNSVLGGHPVDALFCEPEDVFFHEYEPGQTYKMKVRVTNRSALSRRVKILPCATKFFRCQQSAFPGTQGMLAPGISMYITVYFTPDSYASFNDEITIWADSGSVTIPVRGQRPAPNLDLKEQLSCNVCLIGATAKIRQMVTNLGGVGRFWVFPKVEGQPKPTMHDVENAKDAHPETVQIGKFKIVPGSFQLKPKEKIAMEISFTSENLSEERTSFYLLCDNQDITEHRLTARAEDLQLELTSVKGNQELDSEVCSLKGALPPEPERDQFGIIESDDKEVVETVPLPFFAPSSSIIFDGSTVGGSDTQSLVITNTCPIPTRFHWEMPERKKEKGQKSLFSIRPKRGEFGPFERVKFEVHFRPRTAALYEQLAHLVIDALPNRFKRIPGAFKITSGDGMTDISLPFMGFKLQGRGLPGVVKVAPPLLLFGPNTPVSAPVSLKTVITNASNAPIIFAFRTPQLAFGHEVGEDYSIQLSHRSGQIQANSSLEVTVILTVNAEGKVEINLPCQVHKGQTTIIRISATAVGPVIRCLTPWLEYGPLNFGKKGINQTLPLLLQNTGVVPAKFALLNARSDQRVLSFNPQEGVLAPSEKKHIKVTFSPLRSGDLQTHLKLQVDRGKAQYVGVGATVEVPEFALTPGCSHKVGTCYVGVEKVLRLALCNKTRLSGVYKWERQNFKTHLLEFQPTQGSLGPNEEQKVTVRILPRVPGPLHVLVGCDVEGLEAPLGLEIKGEVLPLSVSSHVMHVDDPEGPNRAPVDPIAKLNARKKRVSEGKTEEEAMREKLDGLYPQGEQPNGEEGSDRTITGTLDTLDMGPACTIFSQQDRMIVVRNHTAIPTNFHLSMKRHLTVASLPEADTLAPARRSRHHTTSHHHATHGHPHGHHHAKKANLHESLRLRRTGTHTPAVTQAISMPKLDGTYESKSRFRSQHGREYIQGFVVSKKRNEILKKAHGIAFCLQPSSGTLPPFSTVRVKVSCINNMCGVFADELQVAVDGLAPRMIPVNVGVTGSPIAFPKDNPGMRWEVGGQKATLAWRDVAERTGRYSKAVSVENKGPVPMRVKWTVHDYRDARHGAVVLVKLDLKTKENETSSSSTEEKKDIGDDLLSLSIAPYKHPQPPSDKPYHFKVSPECLDIPAHSRAKMTVTFDSDVAPGGGEQCASFLQGKLFVKKKDAKLLTPQDEAKGDCGLEIEEIEEGDIELSEDAMERDEDALTDDEGNEGDDKEKDAKLKGVMCDIDQFEAKLRKIKRSRSLQSSSSSMMSSRSSLGAGMDEKHSADTAARVSKRQPPQSSSSSSIKEEWIPAPAPLDSTSLMLSLEAKATLSVVEVDKRKGEGGAQCVKYVVGPYADSSSDSAETPLVKTVPISNRSRSVVRLGVHAEPKEWFQVVYLSDSPGDAEEAKEKIVASLRKRGRRKGQSTVTASKFARTVSTEFSGGGTLLAPGEAAHIGVRLKAFPPTDVKRWPVQPTSVQKGALVLTFDGRRTQVIDLKATMLRPCVEINHAFGKPTPVFTTRSYVHNFGMSYLKVTASATIEIRNPTRVPARWRIVHVPREKSTKGNPMDMATLRGLNHEEFDLDANLVDDPTVFSFVQMSGVVAPCTRTPAKAFATKLNSDLSALMKTLASGTGLSDTRPIQLRKQGVEHLQLGMGFSPKNTKGYLSRFVLEIEHGYPRSINIELRGQGTLAEDKKRG
mmetsp:Transcript_21613/g.43401  ORF Transcript_21613/g.43401 Transcript_21613/m.43401 type:complete len:2057 (+) Transcript_21613:50-6220(+)|eukprot:CAMPEP_0167815196 /NCGR_PEP_ID=MMETSP0112_2-20121227/2868_1 /TAXON_ID=91324 /ORGANISM="Lotharella globosa, Strain CCCM811" /LENGTH=2056 /DNA_ID=CAMNT_0007714549 /DNA_START=23 /DNA_END=6193 /DNA_ORIENTATION=-